MSHPDVVVRRLEPADDRSAFRSGDIELDRFFHRYAGQNQFRHHLGTTWVAESQGRIVGFSTVSAAHLEVGELPVAIRRRLPAYPLPVLRLARLAVAEARGQGVGRVLLRAIFTLAWRMAEDFVRPALKRRRHTPATGPAEQVCEFGCVGVVVDAKSEAVGFYERLGFRALDAVKGGLGERPAPTPMFLELSAVPRAEVRR